MSWFHGDLIEIAFPALELLLYGAQFKTQILGAPPSLTYYQRKKWAVAKMEDILALRGEGAVLAALHELRRTRKQKLDDVADCVVMAQAIKFQKMVACW